MSSQDSRERRWRGICTPEACSTGLGGGGLYQTKQLAPDPPLLNDNSVKADGGACIFWVPYLIPSSGWLVLLWTLSGGDEE